VRAARNEKREHGQTHADEHQLPISNLARRRSHHQFAEGVAARREFWVVKHGIKMSAMPAWGKTLNDAAIWDIVAFARRMPLMTPEAYQQLSR